MDAGIRLLGGDEAGYLSAGEESTSLGALETNDAAYSDLQVDINECIMYCEST
jgi:hypothetical protein